MSPTSIQHCKFYTGQVVRNNVTVFYSTSKEAAYVLTVSFLGVICPLHESDHRTMTMNRSWKAYIGKVGCTFLYRTFEFSLSHPTRTKNLEQRHRISGQTIKPET